MQQAPEPFAFVSYRRRDCKPEAVLVAQTIDTGFGSDRVFIDESIKAGERFPEILEHQIQRATVMIVVMGQKWLKALAERDGSRTSEERDWVRHEIRTALGRRLPIIPVLFQGDRELALKRNDLPADIADL